MGCSSSYQRSRAASSEALTLMLGACRRAFLPQMRRGCTRSVSGRRLYSRAGRAPPARWPTAGHRTPTRELSHLEALKLNRGLLTPPYCYRASGRPAWHPFTHATRRLSWDHDDAIDATGHRVDAVAATTSCAEHRGRSTRSERPQIRTRDHPAPPLLETTRVDGVKAP